MSLLDAERELPADPDEDIPDEDILTGTFLDIGYEIVEESGPNGEKWQVFIDAQKPIYDKHVEIVPDEVAETPRDQADDLGNFVLNRPI